MYNYISIPLRLWDTWTLWILSIWIFNHSRSNHFEFWFGTNRNFEFSSLTSFFLFRQSDARVRAATPWLIFLRKYANWFSVLSLFLPCCVLAQTLSFMGERARTFPKRLKTLNFNEKFVKTWSKVQGKFWRIRPLTHFLLGTDLGRIHNKSIQLRSKWTMQVSTFLQLSVYMKRREISLTFLTFSKINLKFFPFLKTGQNFSVAFLIDRYSKLLI